MSEYITIISREELMKASIPVGFVLFAIACAILFLPTIIGYIVIRKVKHKQLINVVWVELTSGFIALIFCIISSIVIVPKFAEPSGKYRYKATINKDKITVSEYIEFMEKYEPEIEDGYYYFEYGELD